MNYTEPFLRKVETAQEEEEQQQHQHQSGVSYRAAVAANKYWMKLFATINLESVLVLIKLIPMHFHFIEEIQTCSFSSLNFFCCKMFA